MGGIGVKKVYPQKISQISNFLQGLCHISELSSNWLAKTEDVSFPIFSTHKQMSW
jgi:hypothetical protein